MKLNHHKITLIILSLSLFFLTLLFIFLSTIQADIPDIYHTYDELSNELKSIEENHTSITKLYKLGKTFENHTIFGMKISDNPNLDEEEPRLLFMGGIHANELVSVEMPMYLINYLVENYEKNDIMRNFIDNREIWIVPMINPDGHVYVENVDENWRKNRFDNGDGIYGVDLNRNFGYNWGVDNYSTNETKSEFYHGSEPFSENETRIIRDLTQEQNFTASISFHSWGEYVLYPWGYSTDEVTKDNDLLFTIASKMASFSKYKASQASEYYMARGDSEDWLYSQGMLSFTIELGK